MADNKKTTEEDVAAALDGTELLRGVQAGGNVQMTVTQIRTFIAASTLAIFAATTSAELAGVISDETGSGALVFATSPTLVTPVLGVASGTSLTLTPAANTEALTISGASLTGSNASSFASIAGTWNTSGTPAAFKINVTDTASNAASRLIDVGTGGGSYATKFAVTKVGNALVSVGTNSAPGYSFHAYPTLGFFASSSASITATIGGNETVSIFPAIPLLRVASNLTLSWASGTSSVSNAGDTHLTRKAAATLHHGDADSASPVAQTVGVQGSRSGTDTDVAGANLTVRSGIGTGNSTGSSLIFQTPLAVASGNGAQTSTTRLTIGPTSSAFTQTVGIVPAADTEALTISGGSVTGSGTSSFASIAGTWNTSGTPSAFKINVTNTASGAASYLIDAGTGGGSYTQQFAVRKDGAFAGGSGFANSFSVIKIQVTGAGVGMGNDVGLSWAPGTNYSSFGDVFNVADTFIRRTAAASIRFGQTDAASPVAQTLGVQGSRSGTDSNVAGANLTVRSGIGTGNSTGSSLIFETPTAVASGTGAQTSAARLTLTEASSAFTNAITGTAAATILSGTAIPAGGTAGSGYKFSSTSNFGVFFGSSAPGLAAAKGSLYLRSDGSGATDRAYINTDGGTTWTNLVTAG